MTLLNVYKPTDDDRKLIDEFRSNPNGQHSKDLQRLLNLFRGEDIEGKYIVLCNKPFKEWELGQTTGRAKPIKRLGLKFTNLDDAEWEVFKRRWKRYTGETLK
ncbi:MAG: ABC transporter permease [Rhodospirillales bacterium]|nr:ABC transporter permease [Rhodospirillales bacterium]